MKHVSRPALTAAMLITPSLALAHAGHGLSGWLHGLSMVHLAPAAIVLTATLVIGKHLWSRSQR
ncbi:MAG: hypothetical protein AB8B93_01220 [Pseudomonadales bacterium]